MRRFASCGYARFRFLVSCRRRIANWQYAALVNSQTPGGLRFRMSRRSAKKRMLLIVNPYATTVSDRLKNLVA